jgi:hypothetical protein
MGPVNSKRERFNQTKRPAVPRPARITSRSLPSSR